MHTNKSDKNSQSKKNKNTKKVKEIGGRKGPEPTRVVYALIIPNT